MSPIGHDLYPTQVLSASQTTMPHMPLASFISTTVQALQAAVRDMQQLQAWVLEIQVKVTQLEQRLAELYPEQETHP